MTIASVLGARLKRHYSSGLTASTWTDAMGVSNATQATSTRQPTITSTSVGYPIAYFSSDGQITGSNADLMIASAAGASATPNYTLIGLIMKVAVGYANDGVGINIVSVGAQRANIYIFPTVDHKLRAAGFNAQSLAEQTSGTINDGLWHRIIAQFDESTDLTTLWIDGIGQTSIAQASDNLGINLGVDNIRIASSDTIGTSPLNAMLGCIFIAQDSSSFAGDIASLDAALLQETFVAQSSGAGPAITIRASYTFDKETG